MLRKEVKLILADGKEYNVKFCRYNNLIYGLKDFFANYAVIEGDFISFAYVGSYSFYITIYSNQCVDILNGMANKLFLRDVRKQVLKNPMYYYAIAVKIPLQLNLQKLLKLPVTNLLVVLFLW